MDMYVEDKQTREFLIQAIQQYPSSAIGHNYIIRP